MEEFGTDSSMVSGGEIGINNNSYSSGQFNFTLNGSPSSSFESNTANGSYTINGGNMVGSLIAFDTATDLVDQLSRMNMENGNDGENIPPDETTKGVSFNLSAEDEGTAMAKGSAGAQTGQFTCDNCLESFTTKFRLTVHRKKIHKEMPKCDLCLKFFRSKVQLNLHNVAFHSVDECDPLASPMSGILKELNQEAAEDAEPYRRTRRRGLLEIMQQDVQNVSNGQSSTPTTVAFEDITKNVTDTSTQASGVKGEKPVRGKYRKRSSEAAFAGRSEQKQVPFHKKTKGSLYEAKVMAQSLDCWGNNMNDFIEKQSCIIYDLLPTLDYEEEN